MDSAGRQPARTAVHWRRKRPIDLAGGRPSASARPTPIGAGVTSGRPISASYDVVARLPVTRPRWRLGKTPGRDEAGQPVHQQQFPGSRCHAGNGDRSRLHAAATALIATSASPACPARKPETLAPDRTADRTLIVPLVFLADPSSPAIRPDAGERRPQHFGIMIRAHGAHLRSRRCCCAKRQPDPSHSRRDWKTREASRGWEHTPNAIPGNAAIARPDHFRPAGQPAFHLHPISRPIDQRPRPPLLRQPLEGGAEGANICPSSAALRLLHFTPLPAASPATTAISTARCSARRAGHLCEFCWSKPPSGRFRIGAVNARGEINASCRPTDLSAGNRILGAKAGSSAVQRTGCAVPRPTRACSPMTACLVAAAPGPGFADLRILTGSLETHAAHQLAEPPV